MSQSTITSVINFCDVCNLSFESKKALYRHQSYDLKHKELLDKMFESEEEKILERVYNLDDIDYIIKTKPATKPKTKTEEDMSQSTITSVINFCDVCNLSFESKKALYRHQSYDLKHKELLEKMFESEEEKILERVYNLDDIDYIIKTKPATKPKTKTEEDIYTRIKYECKECHEEFRSKVALTTHSYSHNRMYLEKTEDFDINSSQHERILYY